jgi:cob(I)alamin adenosyltransferase
MATKIYTKKGDNGRTSLFSGRRAHKNDLRVTVVGDLDELSAVLGMARIVNPDISEEIRSIQERLYLISAIVSAEDRPLNDIVLPWEEIHRLEAVIDRISSLLPPLKDFIFPGESEASCRLHVARAVARRAERNLTALQNPAPPDSVLAFVNRLSDLLFVFARFADHKLHISEKRLNTAMP